MKKVILQILMLFVVAVLMTATAVAKPVPSGKYERVPFLKMSEQEIYDSERYEGMQRNNRDLLNSLGKHHVSKRGLRGMQTDLSKSRPDTLNVLIIRIGFETDVSGDLTSVTTDGDFRLEPDDARIDPAPHNKDFYESHLFGLSEYYRIQSGGKLAIAGQVLPVGQNDCYKLSDIADYGPGEGANWTIELLETLVIDMIEKADLEILNDELGFTLADYDDDNDKTYVIFVHAGSDWQSDIFRDSPNDIPTFFVTLGDSVQLQSFDSETGMQGALSECSIIPETTTQDGYLGSIAGALYHEFGHSLGLPDVYDTSSGLPAVGVWDLMDSGPNLLANINFGTEEEPDAEIVSGLLPPSLSSWCKWYLGWVRTDKASDGTSWNLPAVQIPRTEYLSLYSEPPYEFSLTSPQVLIGGASSREFFLIENRWVPLSSSEFPDDFGVGFLRDSETGVFLFLAGDDNRNTGMYDYFLPQGGLLVWHVDQDLIEENLEFNSINAGRQGLRLIEADGIRDIGVYEPYVIGFFGSETDAFHSGIATSLHADGTCSTRANDRSWTGFEMSDISAALPSMSFDASCEPVLPNSPIALEPTDIGERYIEQSSVTAFNIGPGRTLSSTALIFADKSVDGCRLFALDQDGAPAVQPLDDTLPEGAFWELDTELAGPPVVMDTGLEKRLVAAGTDGYTVCFGQEVSEDGWAPVWEFPALVDTIAVMPVVGYDSDDSPHILICGESGMLYLADEHGELVAESLDLYGVLDVENLDWISAPLIVQMLPDGSDSFVVFTSSCWFLISYSDGALSADQFGDYGGYGFGEVFPAVIENDDYQLLVVYSETGFSTANYLSMERNAPAPTPSWSGNVDGLVSAEPAVVDLDGDGRNDIVLISGNSVNAFSSTGISLTGFPVSIPQLFPLSMDLQLSGSVVVFDSTGDGVNEIYVTSTEGHLIGLDCFGNLMDFTPLLCADSGQATLTVTSSNDFDFGYTVWITTEGSGVVPGLSTVEVGGRITGISTPADQTALVETSKWLGYRGGSSRSGPVGEAIDLAITAPETVNANLFICYPNPVGAEAMANFRFFVTAATSAAVSVYNLEGELVTSITRSVDNGMINEIQWFCGGISSGVYICRLSLQTDEGVEVRQTVLAIER
ncbi:MAG: T9SS type A sorting domain-containing protein [bacterium]|nr:T9SS type A sorting domain-containing protein [bacterium]MCP4799796.1 T9SS type A sorting domain-containing protein [bacterium]